MDTQQILHTLLIAVRIGLVIIVLGIVIAGLRKFYRLFYLVKRSVAVLELTPPSRGDRTPEATGQLILSLFSLLNVQNFYEKLIGRKDTVSFEIESTRSGGIRYLIYCNARHVQNIEHLIASYLPEVRVKNIDDYMTRLEEKNFKVYEFRQKAHFAYPLKSYEQLEAHDPMAYITNAMTKLKSDEVMAYQVVAQPIQSREADLLIRKIMTNDNLMPRLGRSPVPILGWITKFINSVLFGALDIVTDIFHGSSREAYASSRRDLEYKKQVAMGIKPVRTLSYFEHEQVEAISSKLQQPLFQADIRILIKTSDKQELTSRRKSIDAALGLFATPKYQRFVMRYGKHYLLQRYERLSFLYRLPSFLAAHRSTLAVSELASLYHFPHTQAAKTENVVKSLSKTLPAPISLKGDNKLDVLIGENVHQGTQTPIGLTEAERERHLYIIGGTGNGKTTMILYQIVQDIQNGKGIAVVDPHGDLAEKILHYIPENRIKDVIYMNPDDLKHPVGMNLLELTPDLEGDDLLREKDIVTEATVSVLRKIFSEDDSGGHRIEYVLRNAIQTALTLEDPTLFTIFKLLNDAKFRRKVTSNLEDENLRDFWKNELGKAGEFQRVKMAAGITAKIGRFLFSASARAVLEQPKSTINFEDILAERKILICNFSKGLLGDDTSTLFGTTVLAKLQTASLRRARLKVKDRVPFYLYVDEFQNFATMSFVQMLSEARKYKLFLVMAEQSTSQQDQQRLVDIILANVGTVVCFRSGSPADERLVLPLFSPYIEQGEIANLPSFNFYARIAAVNSQEPMSGITVLLDSDGSEVMAKKVIASSQKLYTKKTKITPVPKKINVPTKFTNTPRKKGRTKEKSYDELAKSQNIE
ncbi:type IV secretion system DNA-binding domain-containing protein [Candidatus Saccharibacteria bacterium]|nr:type IV secretion system DNA-binding domain-containing protein [Candidatus Saccharibacteria bacterium]